MLQYHPVSTPIELCTILRALRRSRGLTQAELGKLLGVSQNRIAQIEARPGQTSFDQVSRLVAALEGRLFIGVTDKTQKDTYATSRLREDKPTW